MILTKKRFQREAQLQLINQKFSGIGNIIVVLAKVEDAATGFNSTPKSLLEMLEYALKELKSIQNTLAKSLPYIQQTSLSETEEKTIGNKLKKMFSTGASAIVNKTAVNRSMDACGYVSLCKEIMEKSIFIKKLRHDYSVKVEEAKEDKASLVEIVDRFEKMGNFFRDAMLPLVVMDFNVLLGTFMKKATESFNNFLLDV